MRTSGEKSLDEKLLAAAASGDEAGLCLLIAAGAGVEARNKDGLTAAMMAAIRGHEASLELLIKAGANIEDKKNDGWTALMLAAANSREACLLSLIGAGADLEATDNTGRTAATLAASNGYPGLTSLIASIALSRGEAWQLGRETAAGFERK